MRVCMPVDHVIILPRIKWD